MHPSTGPGGGGETRERFYRSVVATLALLHASASRSPDEILVEIARLLAELMELPLVWLGYRPPGGHAVQVKAVSGRAAAYLERPEAGGDAGDGENLSPLGRALSEACVQVFRVDDPVYAAWRTRARRFGLAASLVAPAELADGGCLALSVYVSEPDGADAALAEWAERLVVEIAHFLDHQDLAWRERRLRHNRDVRRTIQKALLGQPDPRAIYEVLACSLVDVAGAAAVDVLVDEGRPSLRRVALSGPVADAMRRLPLPPCAATGHTMPAPTQAFAEGRAVVRVHPHADPGSADGWRVGPLVRMGAVGAWPIPGDVPETDVPRGVIVIVVEQADAFDGELRALLDEIAASAGLALCQHAQHLALMQERERQRHLALHDALTSLPNRRALEPQLESALARARRHRLQVGVGMLDLDEFKALNDRLGHAFGDKLLIEVAARLAGAVRAGDLVARLGGDEFVLVLEDLVGTHDLDALTERLRLALEQPYGIDGEQVTLSACLGVAVFPQHAEGGDQLLRLADQAMYRVKMHKRMHDGSERHWWSLPPDGQRGELTTSQVPAAEILPYGDEAAAILRVLSDATADIVRIVADAFYQRLLQMGEPSRLLRALPEEEMEQLYGMQHRYLHLLLRPELDAVTHRAAAIQAGHVHAGCGIEAVSLSDSTEHMREVLEDALIGYARGDRRVIHVLHRRLAHNRQWQLEGMRAVQRGRDALIGRISALAWSADSYLALAQGVVDTLVQHEEIICCTLGRPDAAGNFAYEAVAGEAFAEYLRRLERGMAAPISANAADPSGRGPSGRAWHSGHIERCLHYATDPAMAIWREFALKAGVRSSVALPLGPKPGAPVAVLVLYSPHVGGFSSDGQQAFAAQLKTLLDLALARLAPDRPGTEVLPFTRRERWRARLADGGIEMHYQPLVELRRGHIVELEALARLRDEDGSLQSPARFLPAFNDGDLLLLFREGLRQAVAQRSRLATAGHALGIALNLPPAALYDPRYAQVAGDILAEGDCPPHAVLLEVLESASKAEQTPEAAVQGVRALKALGVRLVEDDLGTGHSSLVRLRQWPFDRVKIDQTLVRDVGRDPLRTLRLIRQLTLLGQALDIEVVVEGLETPGLIEAALLLGADFGQGYALARPSPPQSLTALLVDFRWTFDASVPRTALGALAGLLLWEERYEQAVGTRVDQVHLAEMPCLVGAHLRSGVAMHEPELERAHRVMHEAAKLGPANEAYRMARTRFMDLLVRRARTEEGATRATAG